MEEQKVGAGILNIITESLYDKPIVVFREYVQNSADSFAKLENAQKKEELEARIWQENNNLYFLDNGDGIQENRFFSEMTKIASSQKHKTKNMGYKGIGRLSGIPYCRKLSFINICSFKEKKYQKYTIDGDKYNQIKKRENYGEMTFLALMEEIGSNSVTVEELECMEICRVLEKQNKIFEKQDRGFLVILENIGEVLANTIKASNFLDDLGWLLPVKFKNELFEGEQKGLFEDMSEPYEEKGVPAPAYNIYFNSKQIVRPIDNSMLRKYVCSVDFKYAVGFHSFKSDKIAISKDNPFSGIRIYIDNMLLCDENELLPALSEYGYIEHTANELIQSVRGIGAMIYITDKVNISANARRTFIEVTDQDAINFLKLLAEFVENIYDTRYALSKYNSAKKQIGIEAEKLEDKKSKAMEALKLLARKEIAVSDDSQSADFADLNDTEKRQYIKKKITTEINGRVKEYLMQVTLDDYDNAYENFLIWLLAQK